MALKDKLKDAASKAHDTAETFSKTVKEEYAKNKEEAEKKKAEKEAQDAEFRKKAKEVSDTLIGEIVSGEVNEKNCLFETVSEQELLAFTKDFYEKMVLPGSKASLSCILMHPYIDEKKVKSIAKGIPEYEGTEKPILYIKTSDNVELLFTKEHFYFKTKFEENPKFWCTGAISMDNIKKFEVVFDESIGTFKLNGIDLVSIRVSKGYIQDFMSLNQYCNSILKHDFDITLNEIDELIRQKIGEKIYSHIKKYMVYEDEKILYYAGGLDSLTAFDYVACTDRQIIIVDREMFGATANVKQFYYEDITAMAVIQNSTSNDLFVAVIDSALTAALKMCNLEVSVAGAKEHINTLYTVEAQRVIAIYHECRKNAKENNAAPSQTIIHQNETDVVEQLSKLASLKDAGIITEEEFEKSKASLLQKI